MLFINFKIIEKNMILIYNYLHNYFFRKDMGKKYNLVLVF